MADDQGELTRALGLVKETDNGIRTKRFSIIADKGVVKVYHSADKEASDTFAPSVLSDM